jgi:hypothetical protein
MMWSFAWLNHFQFSFYIDDKSGTGSEEPKTHPAFVYRSMVLALCWRSGDYSVQDNVDS